MQFDRKKIPTFLVKILIAAVLQNETFGMFSKHCDLSVISDHNLDLLFYETLN